MAEPASAIERREPEGATSAALAQIVGGADIRGSLQRLERNVRDVIDVARDRGFVTSFGGAHEFYGLPAWQLLGMQYGLLPFVEWTHKLDNGWEARAVVKTMDGKEVGAAEAMCMPDEPNKRRSTQHDMRAMAQTRAMRNALRAVLGSALVMAGYSFSDPDAPATKDQTKALWTLAGKHDWDRDEAHERAGVDSMKDLTREQAAELIDAWSVGLEAPVDGGVRAPVDPPTSPRESEEEGSASRSEPSSSDQQKSASKDAWAEAAAMGITKNKALKFAREMWPQASITHATQITLGQLLEIVKERG